MLELQQVTRRFGGILALADVSLAIPRQQVYGIVGPNGAGKTTLLRLIAGGLRPDSGRVMLDGTRLDRWPAHRIARRGIAAGVGPSPLPPEATALEQVIVAQYRRGRSRLPAELVFAAPARQERAERRERAEALLELVGLERVTGRPAGALAAGQRRRLELARALAQAPDYLLLDEPAAGLDAAETRDLERLLPELVVEGVGVVLAEHDATLALRTCDRLAVLAAGRLLAEGPAREVQAIPALRETFGASPPGVRA